MHASVREKRDRELRRRRHARAVSLPLSLSLSLSLSLGSWGPWRAHKLRAQSVQLLILLVVQRVRAAECARAVCNHKKSFKVKRCTKPQLACGRTARPCAMCFAVFSPKMSPKCKERVRRHRGAERSKLNSHRLSIASLYLRRYSESFWECVRASSSLSPDQPSHGSSFSPGGRPAGRVPRAVSCGAARHAEARAARSDLDTRRWARESSRPSGAAASRTAGGCTAASETGRQSPNDVAVTWRPRRPAEGPDGPGSSPSAVE